MDLKRTLLETEFYIRTYWQSFFLWTLLDQHMIQALSAMVLDRKTTKTDFSTDFSLEQHSKDLNSKDILELTL